MIRFCRQWRRLAFLPSYEISEDGEVRRTVAARGVDAGHVLSPNHCRNGYLDYALTDASGKRRRFLAHRLVCEAFHGPQPTDKHEVAHFDGDRRNNHYANLRWATRTENMADQFRHGTFAGGERHHAAKLNWEKVRQIRAAYTGRVGEIRELAKAHGVHEASISAVLHNRNWIEEVDA